MRGILPFLCMVLLGSTPVPAIDPGAYRVWVLDNSSSSSVTNDTLRIMDSSGSEIAEANIGGLCESISAWRAISVAPDASYAIVAAFCGGNLTRFDGFGNTMWSVGVHSWTAVDIGRDGYAYALTGGTIFGDHLVKVDTSNGDVVGIAPFGGIDVVFDDERGAIWVVGADIKKVSRDLHIDFVIDPINYPAGWTAVSVDYATDGSAWVAEAKHPQLTSSQNKLLKISPEGSVTREVPLDARPVSLRVDRSDDSLWVATVVGQMNEYPWFTAGVLQKHDREGALVRTLEMDPIWSVQVATDRSVWVTEWDGGTVRQFSRSGRPLVVIPGNFSGPPGCSWLAIGAPEHGLPPAEQ